jgi:hypothetical protein
MACLSAGSLSWFASAPKRTANVPDPIEADLARAGRRRPALDIDRYRLRGDT